jgi:hypothetical protein
MSVLCESAGRGGSGVRRRALSLRAAFGRTSSGPALPRRHAFKKKASVGRVGHNPSSARCAPLCSLFLCCVSLAACWRVALRADGATGLGGLCPARESKGKEGKGNGAQAVHPHQPSTRADQAKAVRGADTTQRTN